MTDKFQDDLILEGLIRRGVGIEGRVGNDLINPNLGQVSPRAISTSPLKRPSAPKPIPSQAKNGQVKS